MSIPANAKLPVPARYCQSPWKNSSLRIASASHGSRPITYGAIASSAAWTDAVSAPLHDSPQPVRPSSVCRRTTTSVTPSRLIWLLRSVWRYGTLNGIASNDVTLIACYGGGGR